MIRPGSVLVSLSTWLLPVAVAGAAIGVHWALHVPPGPLPPPSPQKLEEDKKAADKKKREEERKKKDADRKAGRKPGKVDRAAAKEFPYEPFTRARKPFLMTQLWEFYEAEDFKKEPTFEAWQTAHKPLLAQIVHNTRQLAFTAPPAINVVNSECHTIRCRFTLTGGDQADIETLIEALRGLQVGDGSLWHHFDASAPAPDKKDAEGRFKSQVTVSLMRDLPVLTEIVSPGKGPLSTARSPATPSPASSATPSPASGVPTPGAAPTRTPTGPTPHGAAPPGARPSPAKTAGDPPLRPG